MSAAVRPSPVKKRWNENLRNSGLFAAAAAVVLDTSSSPESSQSGEEGEEEEVGATEKNVRGSSRRNCPAFFTRFFAASSTAGAALRARIISARPRLDSSAILIVLNSRCAAGMVTHDCENWQSLIQKSTVKLSVTLLTGSPNYDITTDTHRTEATNSVTARRIRIFGHPLDEIQDGVLRSPKNEKSSRLLAPPLAC